MVKLPHLILILLITSVLVIASGCSSMNNTNITTAPVEVPTHTQTHINASIGIPIITLTNISIPPATTEPREQPKPIVEGQKDPKNPSMPLTVLHATKEYSVNIEGDSFNPTSLTISAGDRVVWFNHDSTQHEIIGDTFNSHGFLKNESFLYTFTEPGEYKYTDPSYMGMKGTITVV
jgi:plastocyanin